MEKGKFGVEYVEFEMFVEYLSGNIQLETYFRISEIGMNWTYGFGYNS